MFLNRPATALLQLLLGKKGVRKRLILPQKGKELLDLEYVDLSPAELSPLWRSFPVTVLRP